MSFPKQAPFSRIFFLFVFLMLVCSCGGGSSSDGDPDSKASVALQDPDGILASVDISTMDELKEKISTKGALALTVEIGNAEQDVSTEKIIRLLRDNNQNLEYQKLLDEGLSAEVVDKLKQLHYAPVAVEQFVELPDPDIFPMQATDEALAILNREKLKKLNRKLKLSGQTALNLDDFLALQNAFRQVDIVDNFGNLDQQFQNVPVLDTSLAATLSVNTVGMYDVKAVGMSAVKAAGLSESLEDATPQGYVLVNAVDELKQSGGIGETPAGENVCFISRLPNLPMQIANPWEPIDTTLVGSDGNDALVSFPETGIAVIVASRQTTIVDSDGVTLSSGDSTDTLVYYLPITNSNRCMPYRFVGASASYSITLVDMIKPERMTDHVISDGMEYLSNGPAAELLNSNTIFNAKSYTFSTLNSHLSDLTVTFDLDSNDAAHALFNFILYSPSGTVYSGTERDMPERFDRDSGIWRLDILPPGSISIVSNKIAGLPPAAVDVFNKKTLEMTILVNTDPQVQTKEFMLGIVKNISLKTQGENGTFNEGEVTIDLNTNMAPELLIPSYIDDIVNSGDKMNDTIALWQCWRNSEQTGLEFEPDGSCFSFRAEFLRRQELYESAHTYDYQNDPEIYQCRDQNGEEAVCVRGELGPYNMPEPISEASKVQVVMNDFSKGMQRQYQDIEYLNLLSNYYDLYQNWKDRTVQVDTAQFPYDGLPYKTHEFTGCAAGDTACLASALQGNYPRIPVVMQTDRPIFGVPLDRLKESTLPITFDYTASDQDVYDINAANWAFLSYLASQTFNVVTGNFVGLICDSVDLVDDLHDVELAAQDDPLGSARASINRYSSSDPFYGLHSQDAFEFFISGVPEQNTQVDTYGQKLNYAQIACNLANLSSSGLTFAQNADSVLNLDYEELGTAADVYKIIGGTSTAIGGALIMAEAEEIVQKIKAGDIDGARDLMKTSSNIDALNQGQDLFDDLDSLLSGYTGAGSAGNGNNVLKSSAGYLLGTDKKTRAEVAFERVSSVPVSSISVMLDRVKILSNYEEDDEAEIRLIPFVGVISDKPRVGDELQTLFTDSEEISDGDHPWNYLRFNDVADGQTLETPNTVLYSGGGYNTAALYVELVVMEDDSLSVEDDDMVGIFSQTIKLEEIFNQNAEFKWTFLGGSDYELTISEYPIYNSSNQLCLENPLSDDFERQKAHNQNRTPSALVSMTIKLTMGDISVLHPVVDTSLDVGVMGAGRDTYSMEMKTVSEIETSGFNRIFDVFQGNAIVGSIYDQLLTAAIVSYGVDPYYLTNRFTYNVNDFSGDLLPIKEGMTASSSLATSFRNAGNETVKELPLVQLLPDNRLLFVISHDQGARIMIVSYTITGDMTLETSVLVKDAADNPVYSLLNAALSPDRTRLMVPYVPTDYAGTDKTIPAYPKLNLYAIDGDTITLQSASSFGNGVPLTNVEFIDESHVAMLTRTLVFGSNGDAWWPDWETVQDNCSCGDLDCLFETVGRNILLFTINASNRLELTDSQDIFYTPPYEIYLKDFIPLRTLLSMDDSNNDLQLVSTIEGYSSILRLGQKIYQLNLEPSTGDYYFGNSSSYQNTKSLRYNADGNYYCADGITCSGYLRSALNPSRDDTNVFRSEDKIWSFEFADTDRDLVLGIYGNNLQLVSLYDGAAYKGPQISSDMFDTTIEIDDSGVIDFSFTVTDRDTPADQLTMTVTAITEEAPDGYSGTHVSNINSTTDSDGVIHCAGTITIDDITNINLSQKILVSVTDGVYTSQQWFWITHEVKTIIVPFADHDHGTEPWVTDGTPSGTRMVGDVNEGTGSSVYFDLGGFYRLKDAYYYSFWYVPPGEDSWNGYGKFYRVTQDGVHLVKDYFSVEPRLADSFTTLNDTLYFKGHTDPWMDSDGTLLWTSDGTAAGTKIVKDMVAGTRLDQISSRLFTLDNQIFYSAATNNGDNDNALWKSDGTEGGTDKLLDIYGWSPFGDGGEITDMVPMGSHLYFQGTDQNYNDSLWISDGTSAGTQKLKTIFADGCDIRNLTAVNDTLFFDTHTLKELWKSDGTEAGTVKIPLTAAGTVDNLIACNGKLYLTISNYLYTSDGTTAGTVRVDGFGGIIGYFTPGPNIFVHSMFSLNDILYIKTVNMGTNQYSLYALNPATGNDAIIVNSLPYNSLNVVQYPLEDALIYITDDGINTELWKYSITDGNVLIQSNPK
ncbi:conserved hypothetical protein [Desulforapulum autotrophicum HRM2]|uniref:Uncharacterized protein n=1 Tax=Desulforapulum autotrophicum (strain ATCC 43914 / DSM 3382 / VKM B-1955 / HRM2) TaxID=177437 RepID=C0QHH9_DESAH|nr:hypothetical protein [Desulforapulum autotrophicum]ACN17838.1 conserved hypothetical protein [Desulforapulum autotrophicum HRM2]